MILSFILEINYFSCYILYVGFECGSYLLNFLYVCKAGGKITSSSLKCSLRKLKKIWSFD